LRNRISYVRWPSAYNIPFEFHFQNDRGLFLYAMAAALMALLISSLIPALRGSNTDLGLAMRQGESTFSVRRWNLRNLFVAMQLTLSLVLLTLGGLFVRSFVRVSTLNPGFDAPHLAMAVVHSAKHRGPNALAWRDGVVRRIEAVPSVVGVTSIGTLPLMDDLHEITLRLAANPTSPEHRTYSVGAGERFCRVLGIRLLRGRDFELDDRTRQPTPVLADETLGRRLFGDADPVGDQLLAGREYERLLQIIGVTAEVKMRTLGEASAPLLFTPFFDAQLLVRLNGDPAQWTQPLRKALTGVDPIKRQSTSAHSPMRRLAPSSRCASEPDSSALSVPSVCFWSSRACTAPSLTPLADERGNSRFARPWERPRQQFSGKRFETASRFLPSGWPPAFHWRLQRCAR
jgi:putative ABC transport system permease protein